MLSGKPAVPAACFVASSQKMHMCNRAFFFILLLAGISLCSWGFLVHRTTTQLALYALPKKLQPLFWQSAAALVKESVQPDLRRSSDSTEASRHFIDLEMYGDSAAWRMPQNWATATALYTADSLMKYGYLPYWIVAMQERLTTAFRNHNRDSILFYAADLAHYIGDANVPLHTTVNYDGQLTAQKGLHALWESTVPEVEIAGFNLYLRRRARYIGDKEAAVWNAIRQAYSLLPAVFLKEREASMDFTDSTKFRVQIRNGREQRSYTTAFARAYSKQLGNSINQQLLRTARMISDFWYTAWVDAGRPDVSHILKTPYTHAQQAQYKIEFQAYKKNRLLKDTLLLARQKRQAAND